MVDLPGTTSLKIMKFPSLRSHKLSTHAHLGVELHCKLLRPLYKNADCLDLIQVLFRLHSICEFMRAVFLLYADDSVSPGLCTLKSMTSHL